MVLLGGEAGAGKTRLITEFTDVIAGQAVLLSGGCVDLGGAGLAFAPYTAALRGLVRQLGVDMVPGGVPAELGRLLPALGAPRPRDPSSGDAGTARARLFEAWPAGKPRRPAAGGADHRGRALGGPVQPGAAGVPGP